MTGKTPQEAYATRVPQLETAANLLGTVLAPGRSVLGQMGGQAAVQGGLEMLEGKGPLRAAQSAGTAAAGAGALGGLGKFLGLQGAGARAATELEAAQKAYPGRVVQQAADYAKQVRAHAEGAASTIAGELKKAVPALGSIPSTETGLISMLRGRGMELVHEMYDKAMKAVIERGTDKTITMTLADAKRLDISLLNVIDARTQSALADDLLGLGGTGTILANAADAAQAITGKWRRMPDIYRRVTKSLDVAGVGDPAARAAYKTWSAASEYIDKASAIVRNPLTNEFVIDAGKILDAMPKLKNLGALTRRGLGDIESGMFQAARGIPPTPPVLPAPPASITDLPGFRTIRNPMAGHPLIGGFGAEGAFTGLTGSHGFGAPFAAGAALSQWMPKQIVTGAPSLSSLMELLTQAGARAGGIGGAQIPSLLSPPEEPQ
jgi:hypothetical protein